VAENDWHHKPAEGGLTRRPLLGVDAGRWAAFVRLLDEPARSVPELVELLQRQSVFED
jgi:uncharacterized protein (DUF1778 family)